jgi:hypothetical protein
MPNAFLGTFDVKIISEKTIYRSASCLFKISFES